MTRIALCLIVALSWHVAALRGEELPELSAEARAALSATLRSVLVEAVPERIEEADDWGTTKEGFSGLTWRMHGLKLDVEKRTKPVNHGLWKQLVVEPIEPEKNLTFEIASARPTGPRSFAFRIVVAAPLRVSARIERWRQGVKMFNAGTEANATVEMQLDGELEYRWDVGGDGTFLAFMPRAQAVDLRLKELDWRKLGKLRGDAAEEIGDVFTKPIAEQLDRREGKVVEKLNRSIAKRQDKFRVPIANVFDLGGWSIAEGVPTPTR